MLVLLVFILFVEVIAEGFEYLILYAFFRLEIVVVF